MLGQAGGPLHHGLHQGQALLLPQAQKQLRPGTGIGRIPQHPLAGHTVAGHGLHQIGPETLFLQQAGETLPQELQQIGRQGLGLHRQFGQQPLPVRRGLDQQLHQIQ